MTQPFPIRILELVGIALSTLAVALIYLATINTAFAVQPLLPPTDNSKISDSPPQETQAASTIGQTAFQPASKDTTPPNMHSLKGTESPRAARNSDTVEPINLPARIVQVAIGLAVVIAAIFGASWFVKRYGRFPSIPTSKLRVLASLNVGQRERIVLLQIGEEQLLLGVTSQAVQVLHKLDEPLPTAAPPQRKEPMLSFSRRLQDELNDRVVP